MRLKMLDKKTAYIFAHRAEAQCFLKNWNAKPLQIGTLDLYESKYAFVLICGEGLQSASESTAIFLSLFDSKLSHLINLGIAGSLRKDLEPRQIYSVRSSYAESIHFKALFKSFSSADKEARLDCISSADRILSDNYADRLKPFAELVDRELWGIASSCQRFRIPFFSYKLVSDFAGNLTNCFDLSHRAEEFSQILYDFIQEKKPRLEVRNEQNQLKFKASEFYFSKTQSRIFDHYIKSLKLKLATDCADDVLKQVNLNRILEKDIPPKKRTDILLQELSDLLNPFQKKLRKALDKETKKLREVGCDIKFDSHFESEHIRLSVGVDSEAQLERVKRALNEFSHTNISRIINGTIEEEHD